MSVVNLYMDESSMWVVKAIDLGDISDWPSGIGHGFSGAGGGSYAIYTQNLRKPDWVPLNKTDFGTTDAIALHASKALNSHILLYGYTDIGAKEGYTQVGFVPQSFQAEFPTVTVAVTPDFNSFCDLYLATAKINGVDRIGVIAFSDVSFQSGWANFGSNNDWSDVFLSEVHFVDTDNPYYGGGYSEPGGGRPGKQNFGDASDFVNPDSLPDESTIGAVSCGLLTIFSPTQAQLQNLAGMLWSHDFFTFIEKQVTGIEDLFVSLGIVPFAVTTAGTVAVTWLNFFDLAPSAVVVPTEVSLTKAASQWEEFNMGNVSLTGNDARMYASDSVLDYSPYSKLGIYLPFIGYQELDIDECREKTINLKYRIDILSGACVALISINGRTLYQFSGNCMTQIPLTNADYSNAISTAVNVGIASASAGTTAAIASAGDALTASRVESGKIDAATGAYQNAQHAAQVSNAENSLAGATANGFMGMKPNFRKSGAISGSTGLMSVKQPYLCLTTPRQSMPEGYEKVCGFPCNIGGKLGDFSGYTVVEDIRLNGLVATSPEVDEIYQLLKRGVII